MPGQILNILIADDDEGDRKQIRRVLKQTGLSCEYTETPSIEEAVAACEKTAFDCAIVDYRLPGQNGLEGITTLHALLPYMAIIMSTGQGDAIVATDAMKRGALDYIPKATITAESLKRVTENALEKAALQRKIDQQRQELENFANVLVHDLKAPLNSIHSFTRFIEEDLKAETSDKNQTIGHCQLVINAGRRMNALIDTLYQYTRSEAKVASGPVDTNRLMKDTLSNLEHFVQERHARVTYDDLPTVTGNAAQLVQLFQNLIGNGIKYCQADIPAVHVSAAPKKGEWVFSIKDNGIGISEKYYREIFEPFKRLHSSSEYEGTGLGLSTCKKTVERHGGNIWCESKKGNGTTFFFTLPAA